jgi:hypothetical protein
VRSGVLVRFTSSVHKNAGWTLGLVLSEAVIRDRNGARTVGFFRVLTPVGVKIVSEHFMEPMGSE